MIYDTFFSKFQLLEDAHGVHFDMNNWLKTYPLRSNDIFSPYRVIAMTCGQIDPATDK